MNNQILTTLIVQYALAGVYVLGILIWNESVMLSALTGCLAYLLPNSYHSMRVLKQAKDKNALQWLGAAYRSEIVKWLMTGMIFIIAFTSNYQWDPIILFAGYILTQLSGWFVPLVFKGN